jgi:RNA polymerase sigma factor (sigma-70 family)
MSGSECPKYLVSDKECVLRAQKGELDTLRVLHEKYYSEVLRYACSKVSELADAGDITGQVFTNVIDHINELGPPYDFKNWLYAIAKNQVRRYYRDQKYNLVALESDIIAEQTDGRSFDLDNFCVNTNPAQSADKTLNVRDIKSKLKPLEQDILHLKYDVGLTNAEIGNALGKSADAVIKIIARAKKKLEKLYLQKYKSPVYSRGEKNEEKR